MRKTLSEGLKKSINEALAEQDAPTEWFEGIVFLSSKKAVKLLSLLTLHYANTTGNPSLEKREVIQWLIQWHAESLLKQPQK